MSPAITKDTQSFDVKVTQFDIECAGNDCPVQVAVERRYSQFAVVSHDDQVAVFNGLNYIVGKFDLPERAVKWIERYEVLKPGETIRGISFTVTRAA